MTRSDFAAFSAEVLVADDPARVGEVERRPVTGRSLSVSTGYRARRLPGRLPACPRVADRREPHAPVCAARPELAARGAQPVDPVATQGLTRVRVVGCKRTLDACL